MNERERIGHMIAEARMKKGITQKQLSQLTGLQQSHITRIENGKYNTGVDTLDKIATALGLKVALVPVL